MVLEDVINTMQRLHKELMREKDPTKILKMQNQLQELHKEHNKLLLERYYKSKENETINKT